MLIQTHKIPVGGLEVDFNISIGEIRSGLSKKDELYDWIMEECHCHARLEKMQRDFYLQGDLETNLQPVCSRCGELFSMPAKVNVALTCTQDKPFVRGASVDEEADEGIVFFEHNEIHLSEIFREQLFLSLPMRYLCKEDCRGLCQKCGTNLNQGEHVCSSPQHHN